jgi:thymidylate synthase (FAD)
MRVIKPTFVIEDDIDGDATLKKIEKAGRTCYKSEEKITADSAKKFIKKIMAMGHESVIEHEKVSVRVICDRGVTHEIVRHRLASYSQESTRYCNYTKDKFGSEISVIEPCFWATGSQNDEERKRTWKEAMEAAERAYFRLIELGASPQEARSVLPNSLKTEIVVTMNLREWRHFFKLRTAPGSHPQMREIAIPLLEEFKKRIPVVFDDIVPEGAKGEEAAIGT